MRRRWRKQGGWERRKRKEMRPSVEGVKQDMGVEEAF